MIINTIVFIALAYVYVFFIYINMVLGHVHYIMFMGIFEEALPI